MKKKLINLFLVCAMITTSIPVSVFAYEDVSALDVVNIEDESFYAEEYLDNAEQNIEENSEAIDETLVDEISVEDSEKYEEILTSAQLKGLNESLLELGYHGMELDSEELKEKRDMGKTISALKDAVAGIDYVDDEILYLADSKEEAMAVADCYNAELSFYDYGVASARIDFCDEKEMLTGGADIELIPQNIEEVIELSADPSNNLPAVYPNNIITIDEFDYVEYENASNDKAIDNSVTIGGTSKLTTDEVVTCGIGVGEIDIDTDDPYSDLQYAHKYVKDYEVWEEGITGKGVTVAVIDSGINLTHPDLKDNIDTKHMYNPIAELTVSYNGVRYCDMYDINDPTDDNGHGSHCSGIVAAIKGNNEGGCGVAPEATIMPIKALNEKGSGYSSCVMAGINYAVENGADVISLSLGSTLYNPEYEKTINNAYDKGVVVVASAGNNAQTRKAYPAAYDGSIAVGSLCSASDPYDSAYGKNYNNKNKEGFSQAKEILESFDNTESLLPSRFSNYGEYVDISAPGSDYLSTYMGNSVSGNDYFVSSGTSQSCPCVAGIVALMLSANDKLTPEEVREILKDSSDNVKYTRDDEYSFVHLDTGCANAKCAIDMVKGLKPEIISVDGVQTRDDNTKVASAEQFLSVKGCGTIYYTDNGKDPKNKKFRKLYTSPIPLNFNGTKTYKFVACMDGEFSAVTTIKGNFRIDLNENPILDDFIYIQPKKSVGVSVSYNPPNAKPKFEYSIPDDAKDKFSINKKGVLKAKPAAQPLDTVTVTVKDKVSGLTSNVVATVSDNALELNSPTIEDLNKYSKISVVANNVFKYPTEVDLYKMLAKTNKKIADSNYIKLTCSNTKVAVINDGVLYPLKPGRVKVTAMLKDGSNKKVVIPIQVINPVKTMYLESDTGYSTKSSTVPSAPIGNVGCKVKLSVVLNENIAPPTNKGIKWVSSDNSVVKVSSKGVVTPARGAKYGATAEVSAITKDGTNIVRKMKFTIVEPVKDYMLDYKFVDEDKKEEYHEYINKLSEKLVFTSAELNKLTYWSAANYSKMEDAKTVSLVGKEKNPEDKTNYTIFGDYFKGKFGSTTLITNETSNIIDNYVKDNTRYMLRFVPADIGKGRMVYTARDGSGKKIIFDFDIDIDN